MTNNLKNYIQYLLFDAYYNYVYTGKYHPS